MGARRKKPKSVGEQLDEVAKLAEEIISQNPTFSWCITKQRAVQRSPGNGNICGNPECLNCRQEDGRRKNKTK